MVSQQYHRYILLGLFFSFYLANSYHPQLRALMWPVKFAVLALSAGYVYYHLRKNGMDRPLGKPDFIYSMLLLFCGCNAISFQGDNWVMNRYIPFAPDYGLALLAVFVCVCLFSIQFSRFFSLPRHHNSLYFAMMYGAAIVTFSNILLYLLGINLGRGEQAYVGGQEIGRFSGWLDNPNTLGIILLGAFPIVFQLALRRRNPLSFSAILAFSMLLLLTLTGSRSALLGMTVMGGILFLAHTRKYALGGVVLMALLCLLIANMPTLQENFAGTAARFQRPSETVLSGRAYAWDLAVELIKQRPYFGYRMGGEEALLETLVPPTAEHQGKHFHNSYLSLIVNCGIIGAIPLFALLFAALKKACGFLLDGAGRGQQPYRLLLSAMFVGFLVHAFFETWLFSPGSVYGFVFWFSCFSLILDQSPVLPRVSRRPPLEMPRVAERK